jgi:hypothetical protein
LGVKLDPKFSKTSEGGLQVANQLVSFPRLYNDIVNVDLHNVPDELVEASVYAPLVGGSHVLESKGQGDIAVGAEWGDEGGCELVSLLHHDLMIS